MCLGCHIQQFAVQHLIIDDLGANKRACGPLNYEHNSVIFISHSTVIMVFMFCRNTVSL